MLVPASEMFLRRGTGILSNKFPIPVKYIDQSYFFYKHPPDNYWILEFFHQRAKPIFGIGKAYDPAMIHVVDMPY